MPLPPAAETSSAVSSMVSGRAYSDCCVARGAAGHVDRGARRAQFDRDAAAGAARCAGDQRDLSLRASSILSLDDKSRHSRWQSQPLIDI